MTIVIGDSNAKFFSILSNNYISIPGCTLKSINKKQSKTKCGTITLDQIKKKLGKNIKNILLIYGVNDIYLAYHYLQTLGVDKYVENVLTQFIIFLKKLKIFKKKLYFLDILPIKKDYNANRLLLKYAYKNNFNEKQFKLWYNNFSIIRKKLMQGIIKHVQVISINKELALLNNNKYWIGRILEYPDSHIKHDIIALLLKKYNLFTLEEEKKISLKKFIEYDNNFYQQLSKKNKKYKFNYTPPTEESRQELFTQLKNLMKKVKKNGGDIDYKDYKVGESKKNHSGHSYDDIYYFRIAANDLVIQNTLSKGYLFEKYNTMLLHSFIRPNYIIFDIGANIGTMTIPFARSVPRGMVYSFEPFPKTRGFLIHNIKRNGLTNVKVIGAAVGHKEMKTSLSGQITNIQIDQIHKIKGKTGRKFKIGNKKVTEKILNIDTKEKTNYGGIQLGIGGPRVDMITLNAIVPRLRIPRVDVIKVDVEGAEPLVFWGARQIITRYRPLIIFEYNWQNLTKDMIKAMQITPKIQKFDIFKFCRELNYDSIIESDREDFLIIPPGKRRVIIDPKVKWKKIPEMPALGRFNIKGYILYKFITPKW